MLLVGIKTRWPQDVTACCSSFETITKFWFLFSLACHCWSCSICKYGQFSVSIKFLLAVSWPLMVNTHQTCLNSVFSCLTHFWRVTERNYIDWLLKPPRYSQQLKKRVKISSNMFLIAVVMDANKLIFNKTFLSWYIFPFKGWIS